MLLIIEGVAVTVTVFPNSSYFIAFNYSQQGIYQTANQGTSMSCGTEGKLTP